MTTKIKRRSRCNSVRKLWRVTSILERLLIGTTIVCILVTVILLSILLITHKNSTTNDCVTSVCINEAAKIVQQIDPGVDPCNNFYKFACGTYLKNAHSDGKLDPLELLFENADRQLLEIYMDPTQENDHYMVKSAKKLFRVCMKAEPNNLETIKAVLETLGGWPIVLGTKWDEKHFNWLKTTYKLRQLGYPFGIFLDLLLSTDPRNKSMNIFEISIPYIPRNSDETSSEKNERKDAIKTIATMFGANSHHISKEIENMFELEEELRNLYSHHSGATGAVFTINEFKKKIKFNWLEFINNISGPATQISTEDSAIFPDPESLRKRFDVISKASKRTQANYLLWRMVEQTIPYLSVSVQNLITKKYVPSEARSSFCLRSIQQRFTQSPINIMYARKYLSTNKKQHVQLLVLSIKEELIKILEKFQWPVNKDKINVIEKVNQMTVIIGEPGDYFDDKILDDLNVDMNNVTQENFLSLLAQANRNHKSLMFSRIETSKPETKLHEEYMMPLTHRMHYSMHDNVLRLPATLLQNRIVDETRPAYLNHGILGTLLGIELSSFFMEKWVKFDKHKGSANDTNITIDSSKQCMIMEMENFGIPKDDFLSMMVQKYTISTKLAFNTYMNWVTSNEEEPYLIATNYSPNQLFWISTVTCHPKNPYDAIYSHTTQYHDIYSNMVDLSMKNIPEFAENFDCPKGSRLNPSHTCQIF